MMKISTEKIIFITLIIAVITIILLEFVFYETPELFKGGKKVADLSINISLSYIAAYIFYIFTFIIPKQREKNHVSEHVAHLISRLLFFILMIMQDTCRGNISQRDLKLTVLSNEDFKNAMAEIYFDTPLTSAKVNEDGHIINEHVGLSVKNSIDKIKTISDELFKYIQYLDSNLVSLVTKTLRNQFNEIWVNSIELDSIYLNGVELTTEKKDVTGFSMSLVEFQQIYRDIEQILKNDLSHTKASIEYFDHLNKLKNSCQNNEVL